MRELKPHVNHDSAVRKLDCPACMREYRRGRRTEGKDLVVRYGDKTMALNTLRRQQLLGSTG